VSVRLKQLRENNNLCCRQKRKEDTQKIKLTMENLTTQNEELLPQLNESKKNENKEIDQRLEDKKNLQSTEEPSIQGYRYLSELEVDKSRMPN